MSNSKPILFYYKPSPVARFAYLTAQLIGLEVETKIIELANEEHVTEEFIKINPSSTVPALVDGDLKIFESCAIAIYMVDKYSKDDSLYPKDLIKRTKVNSKLFYVATYFFPRIYQICVPGYAGLETEVPQSKIDDIIRGYGTVEKILEENEFLAGDFFSLADLLFSCNMESLVQIIPIDAQAYPKFTAWMSKMGEMSFSKYNKEGADEQIGFYKMCIQMAIDAKK